MNATDKLKAQIAEFDRQATAYVFRSDLNSAIHCVEDALSIAKQIADSSLEDMLFYKLLTLQAKAGNVQAMLATLQRLTATLQTYGLQPKPEACLEGIGHDASELMEQGRYPEAMCCFEAVQKASESLGYLELRLNALRGVANIYIQKGLSKEAIPHLEEIIRVARENGFKDVESSTLNDLGDANHDLGNLGLAITLYEQALALARQIGKRKTESVALGDLGRCYAEIGKKQEAIAYTQAALAIGRAIGDRSNVATWLKNLGTYSREPDPAGSIRYIEEALRIFRECNYSSGESAALAALGGDYRAQGDLQKALQYYAQALSSAERSGDLGSEAAFTQNIAICHQMLSEYDLARKYYERSISVSKRLADKFTTAISLANLAGLCLKQDLEKECLDYFMEGLRLFDSMRAGVWLDHEGTFLRQYVELFDNAIPISVKQGKKKQAFELCDSAKSSSLNRRIYRMGFVPKSEMSKENGERWLRIREDLRVVEKQIEQYDQLDDWSSQQRLRSEQAGLIAEFNKLMESMTAGRSGVLQHWTVRAGGVAELPRKPGSAILEFYATKRDLMIFLTSDLENVHFTYLPDFGRERLASLGRDAFYFNGQPEETYREILGWVGAAVDQLFDSAGLYNRLPMSRLSVIPHYTLHLLPLHIARIGSDYLQDFCQEIHYAPNLKVLQSCEASSSKRLNKLLLVNNPDGSLAFGQAEAQAISESGLFAEVRELDSATATIERILEESTDADVLHFICHGGFDRNDPLQSCLFLNRSAELTLSNLLTNLDASRSAMAFLSACETGMVKPEPTDDYIGLSHGFLAGGAPLVISSLWKVDDLSTSYLVSCFYTLLRQQRPAMPSTSYTLHPALALRKAQDYLRTASRDQIFDWATTMGLALNDRMSELKKLPRNAKPFIDPRYWAPFVPIGAAELHVMA